ncbi:hypothetical protein MRB53_039104 [Persea americana]|nr:hypothetical protein MRB53_039104 [Persea americana]
MLAVTLEWNRERRWTRKSKSKRLDKAQWIPRALARAPPRPHHAVTLRSPTPHASRDAQRPYSRPARHDRVIAAPARPRHRLASRPPRNTHKPPLQPPSPRAPSAKTPLPIPPDRGTLLIPRALLAPSRESIPSRAPRTLPARLIPRPHSDPPPSCTCTWTFPLAYIQRGGKARWKSSCVPRMG